MALQKYTSTLLDKEFIGTDILELTLKIDGDNHFNYIAGQFITVHFIHNDVEIKRSYSIANVPNKENIIKFALSKIPQGLASEFLFNLEIGAKVTISGPVGRLVLPNNTHHPKRYILIATGTGITPYRAMFNDIEHILNTTNTHFLVLFGVRNYAECIYQRDFEHFSNEYPRFDYKVFFSRLDQSALKSQEHHLGYVQTAFDKLKINLNPIDDIVYLCGNPNMIDATFAKLKDFNFDTKNVKREKYISSK